MARKPKYVPTPGVEVPDAGAILRLVLVGPPGTELWVKLAAVLFALGLVAAMYLASRPGGEKAIAVFHYAPLLVPLAALLVLIWGIAQSALQRPFVQPGRVRGFLILSSIIVLGSYPLPYPSSHAFEPSPVRFELPVRGAWVVRWGGSSLYSNRLRLLSDRCHGFDFVKPSADGLERIDSPQTCTQSKTYGEIVYAPAAGTVVRVLDGVPDGQVGAADAPLYGNSIAIEVKAGQYLHLCGLKAGTLGVRAGERVEAGQLLARVGFSSLSQFTLEPHLAVQLTDAPEPQAGEGIPFAFTGYRSGGRLVDRGVPEGGLEGHRMVGATVEFAEPAPAGAPSAPSQG